MAATVLINDSRLCSQNGRVMRPRGEATQAIEMIIIIINDASVSCPLIALVVEEL